MKCKAVQWLWDFEYCVLASKPTAKMKKLNEVPEIINAVNEARLIYFLPCSYLMFTLTNLKWSSVDTAVAVKLIAVN